MKCLLTSADPKSSPTLLMLHSGRTFCKHVSNHVFCWHKLELEQSLLNLLPEPVIHDINVLHPGVVFRILRHGNGRLAVAVDGEFGVGAHMLICLYAQNQSKYISVFSLILFLYYFHFTIRTPFQFFPYFSLFFLPFYSLQKPVILTRHC